MSFEGSKYQASKTLELSDLAEVIADDIDSLCDRKRIRLAHFNVQGHNGYIVIRATAPTGATRAELEDTRVCLTATADEYNYLAEGPDGESECRFVLRVRIANLESNS